MTRAAGTATGAAGGTPRLALGQLGGAGERERLGGEPRGCGTEVVVEHLDAGALLETDHLRALARRGQGDHHAVGAGARRTAAAVEVGLGVARVVEVHDQRDVVDVDAAGGDVGGDDRLGGAGGEPGQVALADPLAEAAVQVDGVDPLLRQRLGRDTAPSRVRVKTMVRPLASTRRTSAVILSPKPATVSVWWVIVETAPALGSSSWVRGSRRWVRTSASTSPSRVALRSMRWLPAGVRPISLSTAG